MKIFSVILESVRQSVRGTASSPGFSLGTRLGEEVSIADQSQSRGLLHSGTKELKATVRSNRLYMTRECLVGLRLPPCNVWSILEVINMQYYPGRVVMFSPSIRPPDE